MKIKIILFIILLQTACTTNKLVHGHPFYIKQVNNYAREIEYNKDIAIIEPDFVNILKKQSIVAKKGIKSLAIIKQVNNKVNNKKSYALSQWMTPKEFYNAKAADCKAYATTKYYELRALGWSENELNLWSGDYDGNPHLILTARLNDKVYVLDILNENLPEAKDYFYKNFIPSYRFNEKGLDVE